MVDTPPAAPARFRVTLAQLDATVGAVEANREKALAAWRAAKSAGADLVMLPEMFLSGYQAQDLARRPAFLRHCRAAAEALAADMHAEDASGPAMLIGAPIAEKRQGERGPSLGGLTVDGDAVFNVMLLLEGGEIRAVCKKHELPNDDVFDENRLFRPGPAAGPVAVRGVRLGVPVCEDVWHPETVETLAESGAEILLSPNGSPYMRGKHDATRLPLVVARVVESGLPLAYLNMVGAQDDQMFDGGSFVLNPGGALAVQAPFFEETLLHADFERAAAGWRCVQGDRAVPPDAWEADYRVMVETTRGYFAKNGFHEALIGLSGGVDSALVAAIACDALGPEKVRCVMLPSEFTSRESLEDAAGVAAALGCRLEEVPISGPVRAVETALSPLFAGTNRDLTEENIQSRLRGLLLMALSNKSGALLLTTGNKSEVAVGYATLYGDMCGAYNPLKDLYKTRVFETCRWRNAHHAPWMRGPAGAVIPPRVIDKPPSAELRPDQKDEDSLPPYETLDAILELLIEREASVSEVVAAGFDRDTVKRVENLLYISEYKRFQSAIGTRLTSRAFWLDRRYPITNRWRDPG